MKKILLLLFIFGFFGCSTKLSKRELPSEKIKDIVVGKTSQRQIYDAFGTPLYHGTRTTDESWWMYIHTTDENSESLSLYFDKDGKVSDFYYSPFHQSLQEKSKKE